MTAILAFTPTVDIRHLPALRRAQGLTQAQFATRIGCRQEDIARFEKATQHGALADKILSALTAAAAETAGQE